MTQKYTQLNKPKHNKHNNHTLTMIWSYSYDPRSGKEVAPFQGILHTVTITVSKHI